MRIWRLRIGWDECYKCGRRSLRISWIKKYKALSAEEAQVFLQKMREDCVRDITEIGGILPAMFDSDKANIYRVEGTQQWLIPKNMEKVK